MTTQNSKYAKSLDMYQRAERFFPYGTQLWSRSPRLGPFGEAPIYFDRAKGVHFWDIDGNEFIDTGMGIGPVILGYCDEDVDRAAKDQIDKGVIGSINNALEVELAAALCAYIPCAEMVKFCKGGGDADAIAVRLARGHTGKDVVLFCGYHGWHDWYISGNLASPSNLDEHLLPGINPKGVPTALAGTAVGFEYNNIDSLRKALEEHAGEVACIIMEACRFGQPVEGYLQQVRELADEHKCLLIFDEVVTGLRMVGGSAQKQFGVTPDLSTLGKATANGYPLAAVVGRSEVMETQGDNFISSLYWSETVSLAAGMATLCKLQRENVLEGIETRGRRLIKGLDAAAATHGVKAKCSGYPNHFVIDFQYGADSRKMDTLFSQEVIAQGVFWAGQVFVAHAHTDEIIDQVLAVADRSFATLARAIETNSVDQVLKAPVKAAGFNRMV